MCLKDGTIKEESEGSFTYRLISGITAAHVISSELSTFTIPEKTIAGLTDNMVFSLVTLKDVEIASPVGAFTNFKTTDPGAADRKANKNYWVEKFPAYYRYYPTCIRDKTALIHICLLRSMLLMRMRHFLKVQEPSPES